MQGGVYLVIGVLRGVAAGTPMGTNPGLVHLLWMLVGGRLLGSRGAVIPGLSAAGLSEPAVRRAWAALGQGARGRDELLGRWRQHVEQAGAWRAHEYEGYRPVAVDVTAFWRPRLRECRTSHCDGRAGEALPAIPVGIAARVGSVGTQRLGPPLVLVRADEADPRPVAHAAALVRAVVRSSTARDVAVFDAGFELRQLQAAGAPRYLVRAAKDVTARRATLPPYPGRGRRRTRGELIRPLARTYRDRTLPATLPDQVTTWQEGDAVVRAEQGGDLVRPDAPVTGASPVRLVVIHDPRRAEPLVLATTLPISPRAPRDLYLDRWPVEQLPPAAKQMLGAARAFVSAPETRRRLPELALLAGSILTDLAAAQPAIPTGSRDRHPRPTPGRLRRLLAHAVFPTSCPPPDRIRQKAAVTAHLPTGFWGQRRPRSPSPAAPSGSDPLPSSIAVA